MSQLLNSSPEIRLDLDTIYWDLDGVFADFEGGLRSILGLSPEEMSRNQLWSVIRDLENDPEHPGFWEHLPVVPGTAMLWAFAHLLPVRNVILTACPYSRSEDGLISDFLCPFAINGKVNWVYKHLGPKTDIDTCERANKRIRAVPKSILIDDNERNCQEFVESGGVAIVHTDAIDTIRILRNRFFDPKPAFLPEIQT